MKNENTNKLGNGLTEKTKPRRHYSQTTTVIFWQHKGKIKSFANAKKELNINLHSKLAESMIISQLHRDGLLDDIIIRVTKTSTTEKSKITPMPFPRQWTLRQLKQSLCKEYKMKLDKIKISMVPNIVKRKKRKMSSAKYVLLTGDDKKLFELGIDHGSQIYITDQNVNNFVSNATIKQSRIAALQSAGLKPSSYHRREQSMPTWLGSHHGLHSVSTSNVMFGGGKGKQKRKKSKKKWEKQKNKKTKSHRVRYSEFTNGSKTARTYNPYIVSSTTSTTPPHVLMSDISQIAKAQSFNRSRSVDNESESDINTDNELLLSPLSKLDSHKSLPPEAPKQDNANSVIVNDEKRTHKIHKSRSSMDLKEYMDTIANESFDDDDFEETISPLDRHENENDDKNIITPKHEKAENMVTNHINIAPIPETKPAPAPAPIPNLAPIAMSAPIANGIISAAPLPNGHCENMNGSVLPPPIMPNSKRKKRLKTRLHELIEEEKEVDIEENEAELRPNSIFIQLEEEYLANQSSQQLLSEESIYDNEDTADPLVPLPDTMLMTNDDLINHTNENIDLNDIFITTQNVGRGKTASVHQALYKNTVFVAVKEFVFQNLSPAILKDFHKEANTLKDLRHPNIAMLIGSYLDKISGELYIVLEWLPNGDLHGLLHSNDNHNDDEMEINYFDVLLMSIDIARGMEYLHKKNLIHRDLKTHNLLLDEEYRVKVTDFGTAKHLSQIKQKAFTEVGTLGYVAPEVLDPPINGYDGKVDVFSYGVVLWEIYSRSTEDNVLSSVSTLQYAQRLKTGFRPNIPSDCPKDFRLLIEACWEYKPQKRPTFTQIVLYLEHIIKNTEMDGSLYQFGDYTDDESEFDEEEYDEPEYEDDDG